MNIKTYKRWLTFTIYVLLTNMATAQTKIVYTPQWSPQAQFAGYYAALAMGFYKDEGLDVTIKHPALSKISSEYLISGQSQFASMQLLTAMKEIDKGHHLVNVQQTAQQCGILIVSHKPLKDIKSLRGFKIGRWKAGFAELPMAIDKRYNLNIHWIDFLSNINLYISGAIDATLAMKYNEIIQLELAGQRIKKNQILTAKDIGHSVPEDGLYVTKEYYDKNKATIEKFVNATRKGWEWAIENPDEALDIVMLTIKQEGIVSNIPLQERMMKTYFELLKDEKSGKRTYTLTRQAIDNANHLLQETGFIKKSISYEVITGQ